MTRPFSLLVFTLLATLASPLGVASPQEATTTPKSWPRTISSPGGTLVVQAPRLDRWTDDSIRATFVAAAGFRQGDDAPVAEGPGAVGSFTITARVFQNGETNEATLYNLAVDSVAFPVGADGDRAAALVREAVPSNPVTMPFDRLLSLITTDTIVDVPATTVSAEPPLVIYRTEPTTLLQIPAQRRMRPFAAGVETMIGVPQPLFKVTVDGAETWYLFDGHGWLSSDDLMAEDWNDVRTLPAPLASLPDEPRYAAIREAIASMDGAKDGVEDGAGTTVVPTVVPRVAHAEGAAELVVVDGDPDWRPVPGTNLLQLEDSTSDVFLNTTDGRYYLLSSGRWFSAASPDAAWSLVAPDAVPAEFRRIPANDAEAGPVLASVPGTIESRQAIARAQVPEIAAIERDDASLVVVYDGSPRFDRIDGTSMQYAVNADLPVIRVKGRCYAVKDAVWFTSPRPTGPWTVATEIPDEIYTIPSDHPLYPVTFVQVISVDDEVVVCGYSAGYENVYVSGGTVVYGTGYWWPTWYWSSWYWSSWYWYHPPSWGWAHWYNPATGRYVAARGWVGPGGAGYAYRWTNPDTGWQGAGYRAASPYARWGAGVATNGSDWIAGRGVVTDNGAAGRIRTSNGDRITAGNRGNGWKATGVHDGNRFVAGNGSVYRRDDGSWQKYENGGWSDVNRTPATREAFQQARPSLDRQVQARERAANQGWSAPSNWNRPTTRPTTRPAGRPAARPSMPARRPSYGGGGMRGGSRFGGGGFRGR